MIYREEASMLKLNKGWVMVIGGGVLFASGVGVGWGVSAALIAGGLWIGISGAATLSE